MSIIVMMLISWSIYLSGFLNSKLVNLAHNGSYYQWVVDEIIIKIFPVPGHNSKYNLHICDNTDNYCTCGIEDKKMIIEKLIENKVPHTNKLTIDNLEILTNTLIARTGDRYDNTRLADNYSLIQLRMEPVSMAKLCIGFMLAWKVKTVQAYNDYGCDYLTAVYSISMILQIISLIGQFLSIVVEIILIRKKIRINPLNKIFVFMLVLMPALFSIVFRNLRSFISLYEYILSIISTLCVIITITIIIVYLILLKRKVGLQYCDSSDYFEFLLTLMRNITSNKYYVVLIILIISGMFLSPAEAATCLAKKQNNLEENPLNIVTQQFNQDMDFNIIISQLNMTYNHLINQSYLPITIGFDKNYWNNGAKSYEPKNATVSLLTRELKFDNQVYILDINQFTISIDSDTPWLNYNLNGLVAIQPYVSVNNKNTFTQCSYKDIRINCEILSHMQILKSYISSSTSRHKRFFAAVSAFSLTSAFSFTSLTCILCISTDVFNSFVSKQSQFNQQQININQQLLSSLNILSNQFYDFVAATNTNLLAIMNEITQIYADITLIDLTLTTLQNYVNTNMVLNMYLDQYTTAINNVLTQINEQDQSLYEMLNLVNKDTLIYKHAPVIKLIDNVYNLLPNYAIKNRLNVLSNRIHYNSYKIGFTAQNNIITFSVSIIASLNIYPKAEVYDIIHCYKPSQIFNNIVIQYDWSSPIKFYFWGTKFTVLSDKQVDYISCLSTICDTSVLAFEDSSLIKKSMLPIANLAHYDINISDDFFLEKAYNYILMPFDYKFFNLDYGFLCLNILKKIPYNLYSLESTSMSTGAFNLGYQCIDILESSILTMSDFDIIYKERFTVNIQNKYTFNLINTSIEIATPVVMANIPTLFKSNLNLTFPNYTQINTTLIQMAIYEQQNINNEIKNIKAIAMTMEEFWQNVGGFTNGVFKFTEKFVDSVKNITSNLFSSLPAQIIIIVVLALLTVAVAILFIYTCRKPIVSAATMPGPAGLIKAGLDVIN